MALFPLVKTRSPSDIHADNARQVLFLISDNYVLQSDFLLPHLTVRETLRFAASLRLPSSLGTEYQYQRVEEVILDLGLKDCANTKIGNEMVHDLVVIICLKRLK